MKPNKARRRTMLYIPGNNPGMLQNGPIFGADSVLLDLEDSVAATQKDAARLLVASVMKSIDFGATEVTVRVNHLDTPFGMADIEAIVPLQPSAIRFPKIDRPEDVRRVVEAVERIEDKHGLPHDKMKIHPLIETALGVENAFAIGGASPRIDAFSIGGQDLTADLQVAKTRDGEAIDYATLATAAGAVAASLAEAGVGPGDPVAIDLPAGIVHAVPVESVVVAPLPSLSGKSKRMSVIVSADAAVAVHVKV